MRVREQYVLERHGDDGVRSFRERASAALDTTLRSVDPPDGWVPFDLFIETNVVIDALFGTGDGQLAFGLGRYGASHNEGVWVSLFKQGVDVAKFAEIAGGLWHKHYDSGSLLRTVVGDDLVRIEIQRFPQPHRTHCLSIAGWLDGVFEFSPGVNLDLTEVECRASGDERCIMELRWA